MVQISAIKMIEDEKGWVFDVLVQSELEKTRHTVSLSKDDYISLTTKKISTEDFVKRCFQFLLDRESASQIKESFDISEISKYFPEFENKIKNI